MLSEAICESQYGYVFGCILKPRTARLRPRTSEAFQHKSNVAESSNTAKSGFETRLRKWNLQRINQTQLARVVVLEISMVLAIIVCMVLDHEVVPERHRWEPLASRTGQFFRQMDRKNDGLGYTSL